MLWSLGLAAMLGVLAVLLQGGDLVWRIVGTGIATAVACALMLPASALVDRAQFRWAGLLGMAAVIVEFLLALSLIWQIAKPLFGTVVDIELKIALTMIFLSIAVVLAIALAKPLCIPRHSIAARTGLAFIAAGFIAYFAAIWINYRFYTTRSESIWQTANAVLVCGLLLVPSLFGIAATERRSWRWAGIIAGFVACLMWVIEAWNPMGSDFGTVIFCTLLNLAAVVAHANLCIAATRLSPHQLWIRQGTITATMATAMGVVLWVIRDRFPHALRIEQDLIGRAMEATGIIAACGTLAMLVLARINRKVDLDPRSIDLAEIDLICPRCRRNQSLAVGESACASCGLRISIRVEEPRCANCDYLLRGLTSDRCPECGTPVCSPVSM